LPTLYEANPGPKLRWAADEEISTTVASGTACLRNAFATYSEPATLTLRASRNVSLSTFATESRGPTTAAPLTRMSS
jgi:hypothetical protein